MIHAKPLGMKWTRWQEGMLADVGQTQAGERRRVRILKVDANGKPTLWYHVLTGHVQGLSQSSAWNIRANIVLEDEPTAGALACQVRAVVEHLSKLKPELAKSGADHERRWDGYESVKAIMVAWRDWSTAFAIPSSSMTPLHIKQRLLIVCEACNAWVEEGHEVPPRAVEVSDG